MRRAPEIVELYQSLTGRGEVKQTGSRGPRAAGGGSTAPKSDLMGEMNRNSSHFLAVSTKPVT
jgi:hypothetical protein